MQEVILKHIIREKKPVTVFIVNGYQIYGKITGFDDQCVTVVTDGREQLVYKHAISTIAY